MRDVRVAEFLASSIDSTLIFSKSGKILLESREKTLRPLIEAVSLITKCNRMIVYDKTLGLAAAKIHSLLNPLHIYSSIMSKEAVQFLKLNGIPFHYHKLVEVIITEEKKTCPYDALARDYDAEELYEILREEYGIASDSLEKT
ncbi:MAG: DUF1893 domain-containing protein [Candidatus Woesearchaeota archaeon]